MHRSEVSLLKLLNTDLRPDDDDDDDDDTPHKFVRPTLATKGSCLAPTQLRIARNETKRFPGSGDG